MKKLMIITMLFSFAALTFHTSCKQKKHKGYINDKGVWTDTIHYTTFDTIVTHTKVLITYPSVPYYTAVKTWPSIIPSAPTSWVNDYANILTNSQKKTLDSMIAVQYDSRKNQISLVIINTLSGKVIEDAAAELYQEWNLWKYNGNKSIMVMVSINDRGTVIEVGSGHKAYLTNAESTDIIKTEMIPEFKKGRYFQGLRDGLQGLIFILNSN
ncbi:MAG: TPM domain-containing protein [Bacteroidia bacterium]|nr:TPM domain-containing protein [Bacteroidia bacterium]